MPLKLSLPTQIQTLAIWRLSCGGRYEGVPPVNNQASINFVVSQDTDVAVLMLVHFDKMKCPKIWIKRQHTTADHSYIRIFLNPRKKKKKKKKKKEKKEEKK